MLELGIDGDFECWGEYMWRGWLVMSGNGELIKS